MRERIDAFVRWLVDEPDREDRVLARHTRRIIMRSTRRLGTSLQQPLVRALTRARWTIMLALERAYDRGQFVALARKAGVYAALGRYEGAPSRFIAEWLDLHKEQADDGTGDANEWLGWFELHTGPFPWNGNPDVGYVTRVDEQGFFDYTEFSSAYAARKQFEDIEHDYVQTLVGDHHGDEPIEGTPDGYINPSRVTASGDNMVTGIDRDRLEQDISYMWLDLGGES